MNINREPLLSMRGPELVTLVLIAAAFFWGIVNIKLLLKVGREQRAPLGRELSLALA